MLILCWPSVCTNNLGQGISISYIKSTNQFVASLPVGENIISSSSSAVRPGCAQLPLPPYSCQATLPIKAYVQSIEQSPKTIFLCADSTDNKTDRTVVLASHHLEATGVLLAHGHHFFRCAGCSSTRSPGMGSSSVFIHHGLRHAQMRQRPSLFTPDLCAVYKLVDTVSYECQHTWSPPQSPRARG